MSTILPVSLRDSGEKIVGVIEVINSPSDVVGMSAWGLRDQGSSVCVLLFLILYI